MQCNTSKIHLHKLSKLGNTPYLYSSLSRKDTMQHNPYTTSSLRLSALRPSQPLY